MPRYFFDVNDGDVRRDDIGMALGSLADARIEALKMAARIMSFEAEKGNETALAITIRDEAGEDPLQLRLVCSVAPL